MVSPLGVYSPNVSPTAAIRDPGTRPVGAAAGAAAPGPNASPVDVGLARQGSAGTSAAGPSRPNVALLEAMQANLETSALLSSLPGPGDRVFQAPSPSSIMPGGQYTAQRPSLALLESMQTGRTTSALLSSVMGTAPGVRSFETRAATRTQDSSGFANPGAAVTNAEDIIRAAGSGQPWIQGSRVAHVAYLMEILAQGQVDQPTTVGGPKHEWFA